MASNTQKKKKIILYIVILVGVLVLPILAQKIELSYFEVAPVTNIALGVRATAMGGNYVGLANDVSAIYWNPAGLAFTPVREIQVGLDGLSFNNSVNHDESYLGSGEELSNQMLHLNSVTLHRALQTTKGGFSFALGYHCPILFNDEWHISIGTPDGYYDNIYREYFGKLNYWTGAFGAQIAPRFGVGISASFVHGRVNGMELYLADDHSKYMYDGDSVYINNGITSNFSHNLVGYDLRFGLLYSEQGRYSFGLRFVAPQNLSMTEEFSITYDYTDSIIYIQYAEDNGRYTSSYSAAFGASFTLPFVIFSAEVDAKAPHLNAQEGTAAAYWSLSGGAGAEIPLPIENVLLRFGYNISEYNRNNYVVTLDEMTEPYLGEDNSVSRFSHRISSGISLRTNSNIVFDFSYVVNLWELNYKLNMEEFNTIPIVENHLNHRVHFSTSYRF